MWCTLPKTGSEPPAAAGTPTAEGLASAGADSVVGPEPVMCRVLPRTGSDPPAAAGTPAVGTAAATRELALVDSAAGAGAASEAGAAAAAGAGVASDDDGACGAVYT